MAGCDDFANPMAGSATFANEILHIYCANGDYL